MQGTRKTHISEQTILIFLFLHLSVTMWCVDCVGKKDEEADVALGKGPGAL